MNNYRIAISLLSLLWGFITNAPLSGFCYSYPVASINDCEVVMLCQRDNNLPTFYTWHVLTHKVIEPIIPSHYNAALVNVLPGKDGLSFIDDEAIYIRNFERRSAKRVPIDEPIYGIELINWIDNEHCYFHAYEGGRAGIYQLSTDGDLIRLSTSSIDDYLYPQIVGDQLFYIKRSHDKQHQVVCTQYDGVLPEINTRNASEQVLVDFGNRPIMLLHMLSSTTAFFLEHPATREMSAPIFPLRLYLLSKTGPLWKAEYLFTIHIPSFLLFDETTKLYESLVPFVPCHANNFFYFCSCPPESNYLEIFRYDCINKKKEPFVRASHHLLAPLVHQNYLIYGAITADETESSLSAKELGSP